MPKARQGRRSPRLGSCCKPGSRQPLPRARKGIAGKRDARVPSLHVERRGTPVTKTSRDTPPRDGTHPRPLQGRGTRPPRGRHFQNSGLKEQGRRAPTVSPGQPTPSKRRPPSNHVNTKPLTAAQPRRRPSQQTRHTRTWAQAQHHGGTEPLENTEGSSRLDANKPPPPCSLGAAPTAAPLAKPGPTALERRSSPPGKGRLRVGKGYSRAAEPGL